MKNKFTKPLLGAFFLILNFSLYSQEFSELTVVTSNINSNNGMLYFYLYNNKENFPTDIDKAYKSLSSNIENNSAIVVFKNIPYGKYAVAVHHDENDNGIVDTNFLGIPTENFGASNNAKGFMGPPSFEDAEFKLDKKNKKIRISMD